MPERHSFAGSSLAPALVVLLAAALIAGAVIWRAGGDPLVLARLGPRYAAGQAAAAAAAPSAEDGYDGQFVYYIACDPNPQRVAAHLDVPAYRYQRILLPLLARALAGGHPQGIAWALAALGVVCLAAGTWVVGDLLAGWGVSCWYALVYGLWAGFLMAVIVDLPEPLAYGLAAGGLLAVERGRARLGWLLLGLAVFAKESVSPFVAALLLTYLAQRRWAALIGLGLTAGLPYALFQGWLWLTFGQLGLGSGGAMATPFEIVPFMGLLRIGQSSLLYLLAMTLVFGPSVILPALWGLWKSARRFFKGETGWVVTGLLLNAAVIPFTPFSTFRETGGMIRYTSGLMLGVLCFAACYRERRALNYSLFWMVLNVLLLK